MMNRKNDWKNSQNLEIEWLWGNKGESKVIRDLTLGSWDNVTDTHGENWKGLCWGSHVMQC